MARCEQNRVEIRRINWRTTTVALAILLGLLAGAPAMRAQTFTVLHTLTGPDGRNSVNGLAMDRAGNLYGTAQSGGLANCPVSPYGCGTVFKLTRHGSGWTFNVIYKFTGVSDGWQPQTIAIGPDGNLYGTTYFGGPYCAPYGCGTVFRLQPPAAFCQSASCSWVKTTLYQFGDLETGSNSSQTVTFDQAGNVYGTTGVGGSNGSGTVWELVHANGTWTYNLLYNRELSGGLSDTGVVFDAAGNLWDTGYGGRLQCGAPQYVLCGILWKLTPSGSGWNFDWLYSFTAAGGGLPSSSLIFDPAGNVYGTVSDDGPLGGGGVFQYVPSSGTYTLLYNAAGNPGDYNGPQGAPAMDQAGNVYAADPSNGAHGAGYVFKLTPQNGSWVFTDLHDFADGNEGYAPYGPLVVDAVGNVYGVNEGGVIFEITP